MSAGALARTVHPGAWWAWALGMAIAVSVTTNLLLLALALAVILYVVAARRADTPWARSFRLYLWLGGFIIGIRAVLYVVVGFKSGATTLIELPSIALPSWAAGISLFGPIRAESLVATLSDAARLAVIIIAIGAANALANPKRVLRMLPGALHDLGVAVVVAMTVAPQLTESVRRVSRAQALRGGTTKGIRAVPRVALPVLEDTLERSLALASAMDSRGYGRRSELARTSRVVMSTSLYASLLLIGLGSYGLLDGTAPRWLGLPVLLVGMIAAAAGLRLGGQTVIRSRYRPDTWAGPEWGVLGCGLAVAVAFLVTAAGDPTSLAEPVEPLALPALPWLPTIGLLIAALPALLTPAPPVARRRQ